MILKKNRTDPAKLRLELSDFDVILCDVWMPGMSRFQVLERVHKEKPWLLKKIILVTGLIDTEVKEYSQKYGCRYLNKPFDKELLVKSILKIHVGEEDQTAT